MTAPPPVRATFEIGPVSAGSAFGFVVDGPAELSPTVVEEAGGRAVVEFPSATWCDDVTQLVGALLAGEAMELAAVERCRLVDLEIPEGLLSGPAFAAPDRWMVGATVRPAVGLSPREVGEVAASIARAGADLVCDDPLLGDPPWCPVEERVGEVARRLPGDVVYCVNVTGPVGSLRWRAERALELGATGLMVCAGSQGIDAVRLLRECDLGVPLLAHRVGAGPLIRNDRFGCTAEVLTLLLR
jgi:ribulose 1,5-bisphosphate carboxylase large subunit-like protein